MPRKSQVSRVLLYDSFMRETCAFIEDALDLDEGIIVASYERGQHMITFAVETGLNSPPVEFTTSKSWVKRATARGRGEAVELFASRVISAFLMDNKGKPTNG